VVLLDELIEIDTQQLEHETQVPPEHEVIKQAYGMILVLGIKVVVQLQK
jgi:hypothetical protein